MAGPDHEEPTRGENDQDAKPTLVVGLGASAGGIRALQDFFAHVKADAGPAYVVVLHLSPDHDSRLAEVLQTVTPMPVSQVRERVTIERNHVYVIPPRGGLTIADEHLVLTEAVRPEQRRAPVDVFFRALAEAHTTRAVAVVLSGTGPNGSSGIKRVKELGGLCVVQRPDEAEYADMPRNSIATGVIDFVLPVAEIPRTILDYQQLAGETSQAAAAAPSRVGHDAVREILTLLRIRSGHDFSHYKEATVGRRIARRMAVREQRTIEGYAEFLRQHQEETAVLIKELLISVTNFFRDADAYAALERHVVPRILEGRHGQDQVRVWVAGCATGEEAYSLAMLLAECASTTADPPSIQLFATDLDSHAIAMARQAFYTEAEVADVPEDRLRRFFYTSNGGYRIGHDLREMVLFATHNVIRDPPFSHLDLIACRNLLIYLNRPVQEKLLETFHFALRPNRYLFLGTAESIEHSELFAALDKSAHIYESRTATTRVTLPLGVTETPEVHKYRGPHLLPEIRPQERLSAADLHFRLLDQYAAPSIVVTEEHHLIHVSERAARFLEFSGGEPSRDLSRVIIPELRVELRTALHQAARQRSEVEVGRIQLSPGHGGGSVRPVVRPVLRDGDPARGYFLVLFDTDPAPAGEPESTAVVSALAEPQSAQLEEELARVQSQLRATVEQYESQVEEARATNEELQAMNEELRSAAEELETSKEELQSVNEELTTVNQELKIKIEELALTNNDFQNFINSTDIGTIFLDRSLRVKLSTARAREVFNLLPGDTGRRLSDITSSLLYDGLQEDVSTVLERLQPVEREVATRTGGWYLMRILPYRTADNRIDGVVMTLLDIARRREAELRTKAGEERMRMLIDSPMDYAIFTITPEGRIDLWNAGAERMFGYPEEEIIGQPAAVLFTPEDRAANIPEEELRRAFRDGRAADERYHVRRSGERFYCSGVTTRIGSRPESGFVKVARDLTAQRESELALKTAHGELERRAQERNRELEAEIARRTAAQEQVTNLVRKLVTAQEDERARIARDLHDQLGQQLTALRLTLDRCSERTAAGAGVESELQRASDIARDIDTELDFLAWELRPAALDDLGLIAALPRFVREWSDHYEIPAEFRTSGFTTGQLSPDAELMFYRIAQEALNNIVKHAHANRVDVILEAREGSVVLVIEDDGIGFDPADPATISHGIGLMGMRERAVLSGATLDVESVEGEGTTVFVKCAVAAAPERSETTS